MDSLFLTYLATVDPGPPILTTKGRFADCEIVCHNGASHCRLYPDDVARELSRLPGDCIMGLHRITYAPEIYNGFQHPTFGPSRLDGRYHRTRKSIMLGQVGSFDNFRHTLFHEIGHHVWFGLAGETKDEWTKILPAETPITAYASVNEDEDFAESFAMAVLDRLAKDCPLRARFLIAILGTRPAGQEPRRREFWA